MSDEDALDPIWIGATINAEFWHFHSQLFARYGIVLAPGEFSLIFNAIVRGKAQLIKTRRRNQAIYSIRIPSVDDRIYVLADGKRIVTAWPPSKQLNEKRRVLNSAAPS